MIFNSAPSDERHHFSSGDTSARCRYAGAEARQSSRHIAQRRLTRSYWLAVTLGTVLAILMLLFALTSIYFNYTPIGIFYTVVVGNIVFILKVLQTFRKHYEAANKTCCLQAEVIEKLGQDNIDLQHDVEYWKAISFTKRGGLTVVGEAAAGQSRSENQEGSAAVVPFKTDGAA
jgi:hypothetical protein